MRNPLAVSIILLVSTNLCLANTSIVVSGGCSTNAELVVNGTEYSGQNNYILMSEVSIASTGNVTAQAPSMVTYVAPIISLSGGFKIAQECNPSCGDVLVSHREEVKTA